MIEFIDSARFRSEIYDYEKGGEFVFAGDKPIILNFFATWCGPCHMFAPVLEEVDRVYGDQLKILKVDIDAHPEIPMLFGVKSVPTTVYIAKNDEPAIASGAAPFEAVENLIHEIFKIEKPGP